MYDESYRLCRTAVISCREKQRFAVMRFIVQYSKPNLIFIYCYP